MLIESVHQFIQRQHGDDCWNRILEHAGLRNTVFATHTLYSDSVMTTLAESCAAIIGGKSKQDFVELFGHYFVEYFSQYGYVGRCFRGAYLQSGYVYMYNADIFSDET